MKTPLALALLQHSPVKLPLYRSLQRLRTAGDQRALSPNHTVQKPSLCNSSSDIQLMLDTLSFQRQFLLFLSCSIRKLLFVLSKIILSFKPTHWAWFHLWNHIEYMQYFFNITVLEMLGDSPIPLPLRYSLSPTASGPLSSLGFRTSGSNALREAIPNTRSNLPGALRKCSQSTMHDSGDGPAIQRANA